MSSSTVEMTENTKSHYNSSTDFIFTYFSTFDLYT